MIPTITPAASPPYRQRVAAIIAALESDSIQCLVTAEAQARLQRYGRNELPAEPPVPAWRTFLAQFQDPLTILLLIATLISLVAWIIEREETLHWARSPARSSRPRRGRRRSRKSSRASASCSASW